MKINWKKAALYQIADNKKMQNVLDRVGHYLITWVGTPLAMYIQLFLSVVWVIEIKKENLVLAFIWGASLVIFSIIGYGYYVPKGYKWYFYIVCAFPAFIGVMSLISAIIYVLFKGMPLA